MPKPMRGSSRGSNGESGQALVSFAIMIAAMMGILALVVDLGLNVFGQRRFDQNGADSAALAAARMLANDVTPLDDAGNVSFGVPEAMVYQEVRRFAGLDPTNLASASPRTGSPLNQNPGLTARNLLSVTLEYKGTSAYPTSWCYSPSGPPVKKNDGQPMRVPDVPPCTLYQGTYPPLPASNQLYRVRVTVSSTVNGTFTHVIGTEDTTPAVATNDDTPACIRPHIKSGGAWVAQSGVVGNTICAHAVAVIKGSTTYAGSAAVIPVGTGNCQIVPDNPGDPLFQLWGSSPDGCGYNINPWKNMVDLTAAQRWCDEAGGGSASNPDYKYHKLLPSFSSYTRAECTVQSTGDTWQRDNPADANARYKPDPNRAGDNNPTTDVPFWVAKGFGGTIKPDSCPSCTDGTRLPTYENTNPGSGSNLGDNIALGFYCNNTVTANTCPGNSPANTYFFAKNQVGYQNVCADKFQSFGVGCRDAGVILWAQPQWATGLNTGGTGWANSGGGGPDRIRAARILNFRIYCDHSVPGDSNTVCNAPPKSVVGNAANSSVWGRFVSPFVSGPCATCTGAPSLNGNSASLES